MTPTLKGALLGALAMLLLLVALALLVVLTGGYNVAATDRHAPPVAWALDTAMHNGVAARAEDVPEPPAFTDAMVRAGAGEYAEYCVHCHGGVGEKRAEWAAGMQPHPPALARAAGEWSDRELFWMIKHGIKMSGMPAFGPTHDDRTLWNITAFVSAMLEMSDADYAALAGEHEH